MELSQKKCKPCEGGVPPLSAIEIKAFTELISKNWNVNKERRLEREFKFVNFLQTMDFVNKLADIAEQEGHHPVMHVAYGKCKVEVWTHAIDGLSENDFILAAKIDRMK